MLDVLVQLDLFRKIIHTSVHTRTDITGSPGILKYLRVFTLASANDGSHDLHPARFGQRTDLIHDLIHSLPADLLAAVRAVRRSDARPEQSKIIVDLRDRADRRTRIAAGRLLVDGDCGRHTFYGIDVRLVHLSEKLPRIGRQALDIAALALGKNRIEGQTGFTRA